MEWRYIADPKVASNRYRISEYGTLHDVARNRDIKQYPDKEGYMRTRVVTADGQEAKYPVHRLVAMAFLPAPLEGQTHIDHIDGNRSNNHVSNLRWCTPKENNNYAGTVVRKEAAHRIAEASLKRKVLCENTGEEFASMTEAAKHFNISLSAVTQSCRKFAEGKPRRPTKFGKPVMHFRLLEESQGEIIQDTQDTLERAASRSNSRAVRCIETGLEYPSASSAARAHGLRYTTVVGSCNRHAAGSRQSRAFGSRRCYHFTWLGQSA